jgi:hypothetical protein
MTPRPRIGKIAGLSLAPLFATGMSTIGIPIEFIHIAQILNGAPE